MAKWGTQDSELLFNVSNWGRGFFTVNPDGHLEATPNGPGGP
jgi:arginine decarboxylase-like protein